MKRSTILAAALVAAAATASQAATTLQLDLNSIVVSGGAGFDQNFSGTLTLGTDANSSLAGILLNGTGIGPGAGWSLSSLVGTIDISGGTISGGSFTITAGDGISTDTYTAAIVNGVGSITFEAGIGWRLNGVTFNGLFSGDTFAGTDVSVFNAAEPLSGAFTEFAFSPDAAGIDTDANMDVFVTIPLPTTAAMASLPLLGLAVRRRRNG